MSESQHPRTDEVKEILGTFTKEEMRQIAKQGFKEATADFLGEIFAKFGRWSFYGILATFLTFLLGVAVFGFAWFNGWRPH